LLRTGSAFPAADRRAPIVRRFEPPAPARVLASWAGPALACVGRADLARFIFLKKNPVSYYPDLQTLINHRIFSINANSMIQVALSILSGYLSYGLGLMILGLL
jgi:hypothetical protein